MMILIEKLTRTNLNKKENCPLFAIVHGLSCFFYSFVFPFFDKKNCGKFSYLLRPFMKY